LICFKSFSKTISDALQKNETLISADQQDYQVGSFIGSFQINQFQKELRRNFFEFTQQLAQIIAGPAFAIDLAQKLQLNARVDKTLPINLHAFTSHVVSHGVGRISSV
jgi:hypothetical protein